MYEISFTNYNALTSPRKQRKLSNFKKLFNSITAKYRNKHSSEFEIILNSSFERKKNFEDLFNQIKKTNSDWIALVFNQSDLSLELKAVSNSNELMDNQNPIMVVPNDDNHSTKELLELIDWDVVEGNYRNIIKFQ